MANFLNLMALRLTVDTPLSKIIIFKDYNIAKFTLVDLEVVNMELTNIKHINLKKTFCLFIVFISCFICIVILQDLVEARFKNSSFYLSESFLFNSFWWLFIPFLYAQFILSKQKIASNALHMFLLAAIPIALHLITFPGLVWLLSTLFYEHTFRYQQTFQYSLYVHLYQLFLLYSIPIFAYQFINKKAIAASLPTYLNTLLLTEGNKHLSINLSDVLYFTANSPYINLHLQDKAYLYSESLKSLALQINPAEFVRIHKSTIVNLKKVKFYTSRLNGDYDLTLIDDTILRISRNFAVDFKKKFNLGHPVT